MMRLFFEPNDVWLFRDGRPFDVFAGHRAHTLFPPFASVIQGAIRSAHLTFNNVSIEDYLKGIAPQKITDEIGHPGEPPPDQFKLRGPFIARLFENGTVERFFPCPKDAYLIGDKYVQLDLLDSKDICTNLQNGLKLLFAPQGESFSKETCPDKWWRESALLEYLNTGKVEISELREVNGNSIKPISVFKHESRIGIHLESHIRRPREGFIYEIEYARLENGFGLEVEIEGLSEACWPETGMVKLGGDGRSARFKKILYEHPFTNAEVERGNTKIYFATPTYFSNGWQPEDWSQFFDGSFQLMAAAVDKPLSVGGIDLAKSYRNAHDMHKPARRYVPAGSVYFFEGQIKLKKGVQAVTDDGENIGFGKIILGRW